MIKKTRPIGIFTNHQDDIYCFRKELIQELNNQGIEVLVSCPHGYRIDQLQRDGLEFAYVDTKIDRRGANALKDFGLFIHYFSLLIKYRPSVLLLYTAKPNIYASIAASYLRIPFLNNITGLGSSLNKSDFLRRLIVFMYRKALSKSSCVFFQNERNQQFFLEECILKGKYRMVPGSGVNTVKHNFEDYPEEEKKIKFLFVGRVMNEKGIVEFLSAAERVKTIYPDTQFDIVGWLEEKEYEAVLKDYQERGIVQYLGPQSDVHSLIKNSHAIVNPSYHEGMSNVLLEAASTGRPVIASNIPGCRETFEDGVSGLGFEPRNVEDLTDKLIKFIEMPYEKKKAMGLAGRRKVEKEFDRNIVIEAYMEEINKIRNALERR